MKRKQELSNIFLSVFFYSILSRNAPHISRKTFGGIEIWHRTIFSHFPNLLFIDPQPHLTVVRAPGRGKLKPFLSEVENLNLELSSPFSRIKVFYLLNIEVFLKPTSLLWEQMVRKKKSTRVLVANLAFCKKIDDQIQHLGGAFENNFVPGEWKFERTNPLKLKCSGVALGECWSFKLIDTLHLNSHTLTDRTTIQETFVFPYHLNLYPYLFITMTRSVCVCGFRLFCFNLYLKTQLMN